MIAWKDRESVIMRKELQISRPASSKYRHLITALLIYDGTEAELAQESDLILDLPGGAFVCMSPIHHEERLRIWAKHTRKPILSIDYGKAPESVFSHTVSFIKLKIG